jgi:outer membrane immunogenic protein
VTLRVVVIGLALAVVPVLAALADEPADQEEIVVPPPPPPMRTAPPPPEPVVVREQAPVSAPPPPFVEFERRSIAAGIGISWGGGTLSFEGRNHPFSVRGISLADLGASRSVAIGDVHNLTRLSDFEGRYVAIEAGAAAGSGASAVAMRNEHGVVITLTSSVRGAQLKLGADGLSIALE